MTMRDRLMVGEFTDGPLDNVTLKWSLDGVPHGYIKLIVAHANGEVRIFLSRDELRVFAEGVDCARRAVL